MDHQRDLTKKWLETHKFSNYFINIFEHWTYQELINIINFHALSNLQETKLEKARFLYHINIIKDEPYKYFNIENYTKSDDFTDQKDKTENEDEDEFSPEISFNPKKACKDIITFLVSYEELEVVHCGPDPITKYKTAFEKGVSMDEWYDIKYKGKYLFHVECVKFGGGFISTPWRTLQYKYERYEYLNEDNWGFTKWPKTQRKLYDFKGKTFDDINKIIDFLQ